MARTLCRIAVLFLLAVLLTAPWSAAAEPRAAGDPSPRAFSSAWSWLSALWNEIGCIIDPNGGCRDSSAGEAGQRDIGCGLDPSGGCGQ